MQKWRLLIVALLCLSRQAVAQETTKACASSRYDNPSFTQKVFLGSNYRNLWSMPVSVEVFRLKQEKGGLVVRELGGGMQTRSLQMENKAGTEYVIRSLDKDVARAMEAEGIKNKQIRQLSQNMISAAHPYGSLTLAPMARAIGILNTNPKLVYVNDDPALGQYRSMFAKTMCFLEERQTVFYEGDEVKGSEKLHKDLEKHKDYHVDQKMLLQARLLDMLVADWDRHDDQWKWDYHKQADGSTIIYPIAKDHDQAYFDSNGMLMFFMRTFNAKRFVGFRKNMKLKALNYKQWHFDYTMLNELSESDWKEGIRTFQTKLTDSVVEEGMRGLPKEIYPLSAPHLSKTIIARRDRMAHDVMKYYHFLQAHPDKVKKQGAQQAEKMKKANKIKEGDKALTQKEAP